MIVKFNAHKFYRHRNCIDIDFYICGVVYETDKYVIVVVRYWNRFSKWFHDGKHAVSINKKDFKNWSLL